MKIIPYNTYDTLAYVPEDIAMHSLYAKITLQALLYSQMSILFPIIIVFLLYLV